MGILGGEGFSLPVVTSAEVVDVQIEFTEPARLAMKSTMGEDESTHVVIISAESGGCSGYIFTLTTDENIEPTDSLFENYDVEMIIDTDQHENIIGNLKIEFKKDNLVEQGFAFRRTSIGTVCGCGESFTPINSSKKTLGWEGTA